MRQPRSPRTVSLLAALEKIYADESVSAAERLEAARLAAKLLTRIKKPVNRKSRNVQSALAQIRKLQNEESK